MVVLEDPYQASDLYLAPDEDVASACGDSVKVGEMKVEIDHYLETCADGCVASALVGDSISKVPEKSPSSVLAALVRAFQDFSDEETSTSDPYAGSGASHREIEGHSNTSRTNGSKIISTAGRLLANAESSKAGPRLTEKIKPSRRAAPYPLAAEISFNAYLDDLGPYGTSSSSSTPGGSQPARPSRAPNGCSFRAPPAPPMPSEVISLDSEDEKECRSSLPPTKSKAAQVEVEAMAPSSMCEEDVLSAAAACLRGADKVQINRREDIRTPVELPVGMVSSVADDDAVEPRVADAQEGMEKNLEVATNDAHTQEGVVESMGERDLDDLVGQDLKLWIERLASDVQDVGSSDSEISYVEQSDGDLPCGGDAEEPSPITPPKNADNSQLSDNDADEDPKGAISLDDDVLPIEKDVDTFGEPKPEWLRLSVAHDPNIAADAKACIAKLEDTQDNDASAAQKVLEESCPHLAQYLIGHPQALLTRTNTRRNGKGGKGNVRFFSDTASLDVMADKVLTGCWACGKLDHQSQDCIFKRCFVCSQQGHEHYECQDKHLWCHKCGKMGHKSFACPEVFYHIGLARGMGNCRCVSCKRIGHVQCGKAPFAAGSQCNEASKRKRSALEPKIGVSGSPQSNAQNGWQRTQEQDDVNAWNDWDCGGTEDFDESWDGAWGVSGYDQDNDEGKTRCKQRGGRKKKRKH